MSTYVLSVYLEKSKIKYYHMMKRHDKRQYNMVFNQNSKHITLNPNNKCIYARLSP